MIRPALIAAALFAASPAVAHVTVAPKAAPADDSMVASFRIAHGCDGKATTALRLELPDAVGVAKPRAIAGWKISIEKKDGSPTAVTWRGRLDNEAFQDFDLLIRTPAAKGPIYFRAIQSCGAAQVRWDEIPRPGAKAGDHPAPMMEIR